MPGRVRVGLVGCGRIARVHRSYLAGLPEVELIGVCDSDAAARAALAREAGVPEFSSIGELVDGGRPEVVHVLTPPRTHAALAIELLEAGVNVLVEKPMALTTAEADSMIATARSRGCWLTVDHNRWFDPVIQRAAGLVEGGALGRLVGVYVFQGAEAAEAAKQKAGSTHWTVQLPGGVLLNLAPHPLYLMRRFGGRVDEVRVVVKADGDRLEEVHLVGKGERALTSVTISLQTRPFMNRLILCGTDASLEVNLNNMTLVRRRPRSLPKILAKVWPNVSEAGQLLGATVRNGFEFLARKQRFYPGIGAHLGALYASVTRGGEPPVSVEEGREVVAHYERILAEIAL